MRLWSLHPSYLDRFALVACWREALLAKKVLQGKTKAYRNHPQLLRFKNRSDALNCIKAYLFELYKEAERRNYNFDLRKIYNRSYTFFLKKKMSMTKGQLEFEIKHLQNKLSKRDLAQYTANLYNIYNKNMQVVSLRSNSVFKITNGKIESWEKIQKGA